MKLHPRNSSDPSSASKRCSVVDRVLGVGVGWFDGNKVVVCARTLSFQGQLYHPQTLVMNSATPFSSIVGSDSQVVSLLGTQKLPNARGNGQ